MGIFAIVVGESTGDLGAEVGRGFSRRRGSDEEGEEATRKGFSATCFWKKEKSPKQVTRCS
jgi:hypothetical protein